MKNLLKFFSVLFLLLAGFNCFVTAQPQYYNFNNGASNNSFPFNMAAGKMTESLFSAGSLNQPTPAPAGTIISIAIRMTGTMNATYTNLEIKMGQSSITDLTSGVFYAGLMTSVYFKASVALSFPTGWATIVLDTPFPYDPTQSLIVDIGQCGYTGTGSTVSNSTTSGIKRVWSVGGCPFAPYASGDASTLNFGINMVVGVPPTVVTTAATAISTTTATLNGTVNANGYSTVVTFEYGLTTAYGTTVPGVPSPVTGSVVTPVSANIIGLTNSTLYHFRVKGVNAGGTVNGADLTFTTTNCPLPATPGVIAGSTSLCGNTTGNVYSVTPIPGVTGYSWTVPPGATITAGLNTNSITVTAGQTSGNVTVSGINICGNGPTSTLAVTVTPVPIITINGASSVCLNSGFSYYSTQTGMNNYIWTISPGGTIVGGFGTYQIQVTWNTTGAQSVSVIYSTPTGCSPTAPTVLPVNVLTLPGNAGSLTGTAALCEGTTGVAYSVAPVSSAGTYIWSLPAGATITSGASTNAITVDYAMGASSGPITVYANNICGNGATSPAFNVTVNSIPPTPVVTSIGYMLYSSAPLGNQWYFEGTLIPGATNPTHDATTTGTGNYWTIVTLNNCHSAESNHQMIISTGVDSHSNAAISIHPVPNDGQFTVTFSSADTYNISVLNNIGINVYTEKNVAAGAGATKVIDLRPVPNGVYTVIFENSSTKVVKKIVVNK
ncbi:MAG: hypothetical protein NTU98_02715 [Bacteroidetes bacterium]|nr:hypothetical protein [Bacteroidota bacterium]